MKAAIAIGALVLVAGTNPASAQKRQTTYYVSELTAWQKSCVALGSGTVTVPRCAKPRDIYVIKDGKPVLTATAACTGIGGKGPCDAKPTPATAPTHP